MRFRVFVVEDQVSSETVKAAFDRDAARTELQGSRLELCGMTDDYEDAIQHLTALAESSEGLPEALLLDNYILDNNRATGRAFDIMKWLGRRCLDEDVPPDRWPRAVLWTSFDNDNEVYTFCALGGVQFQEKRAAEGLQVPVRTIWAALAGRRWRPCPYPSPVDLPSPVYRAALPYLDHDLPRQAIAAKIGCTEKTLNNFTNYVGTRPGGPGRTSPDYPYNTRAAIRLLQKRGWVWVPYAHLGAMPRWSPLPHTIDPGLHAQDLPPIEGVPAAVVRTSGAGRGRSPA